MNSFIIQRQEKLTTRSFVFHGALNVIVFVVFVVMDCSCGEGSRISQYSTCTVIVRVIAFRQTQGFLLLDLCLNWRFSKAMTRKRYLTKLKLHCNWRDLGLTFWNLLPFFWNHGWMEYHALVFCIRYTWWKESKKYAEVSGKVRGCIGFC